VLHNLRSGKRQFGSLRCQPLQGVIASLGHDYSFQEGEAYSMQTAMLRFDLARGLDITPALVRKIFPKLDKLSAAAFFISGVL
jgi:hypothetical protein